MRDIPDALARHLAGGATTLCTCMRLVRADGVAHGFTDHNEDLVFAGTAFEARAGIEPSEAVASLGLKVDHVELAGAVASERLGADDLAAGLYDGARAELWLVNWAAPEQRVLMRSGRLGEVRRADGVFTAELRGLAQALDQTRGRLFERAYDAELGDARCRLDLGAWRREAVVDEVLDPRRFRAAALGAAASRLFERSG